VAKRVKEQYSYVCPDMVKEFMKYDTQPDKCLKLYEGIESVSKRPFTCDVGYERFLGPEIFFNPEIYSSDFLTPLPKVVDDTIQNCPIDTRRPLYKNIVLSGGSTMFKDFGRRLQRDIKRAVDTRIKISEELSGGLIKARAVDVNVITHHMQTLCRLVWRKYARFHQRILQCMSYKTKLRRIWTLYLPSQPRFRCCFRLIPLHSM